MPEGHTVALENPDLFILVEVFKVRIILRLMDEGCLPTWLRASAEFLWSKIITVSKNTMSWELPPLNKSQKSRIVVGYRYNINKVDR